MMRTVPVMLLSSALGVLAAAQRPHCFHLNVPVEVSSRSYPVQLPVFEDSYETTHLLFLSSKRDAVLPSDYLGEAANFTRTFSIHCQYCEATQKHDREGAVQLLTHGFGWDRSYWSFGDSAYNYIEAATAAGYATLSYDRLGTRKSEAPDPYGLIQTQIDLAVLEQLTVLLRTGQLFPRIPSPSKVVHVGHSYGSLLTNALISRAPALSDGVVLTGYTHNGTWTNRLELSGGFRLARENQPARFGSLHPGFLTWGDEYAHQFAFFTYPNFDVEVLREAERRKWPFALGQLVTYFELDVFAGEFEGPVLMLNGANDMLFCGGNCEGIVDGPDSVSPSLFPKAHIFESQLQPETGHGINLHFNAREGFNVVNDFLAEHLHDRHTIVHNNNY